MRERFEAIREEIARNDERIVAGVNRRLELVAELWRLKEVLGLETFDPERERRLRERLAAASTGALSREGLDLLVSALLELTKRELALAPDLTPPRRDRPRSRPG